MLLQINCLLNFVQRLSLLWNHWDFHLFSLKMLFHSSLENIVWYSTHDHCILLLQQLILSYKLSCRTQLDEVFRRFCFWSNFKRLLKSSWTISLAKRHKCFHFRQKSFASYNFLNFDDHHRLIHHRCSVSLPCFNIFMV